jgi:hypothetical protein
MAKLKWHATAEGITHHVGLVETKLGNQGSDVVRHQLKAQGAIDVSSSAMSLQIDGDDAA